VVDAQFRKQAPLFSAEERKRFLVQATSALPNVEIEIFSNLLVEFAREQGATVVVKGLRAISDFEFEFEMNQLNRKLAPEIESVYIIASPDYSFLSSTGVKEMAAFGGDVSDLVPAHVASVLGERLARS
jgi:pantetheine-phosphate adenylyltransferase